MHQCSAPCSLEHFKNQLLFALFSQQTKITMQYTKRVAKYIKTWICQHNVFLYLPFKRRTGDELGFIVRHKINQVFEYSNNDGENFKQLSLYLPCCRENKVFLPSMGGKDALYSYNLKLEDSQVSNILSDQHFSFLGV